MVIEFTEHLQNVTTKNYDNLTELHTPKITNYSTRESLISFISRSLVTADVPLPLGSRSQNFFTTCGLPQISSFWRQVLEIHNQRFFLKLNPCGHKSLVGKNNLW
jgi:hypothetical protein